MCLHPFHLNQSLGQGGLALVLLTLAFVLRRTTFGQPAFSLFNLSSFLADLVPGDTNPIPFRTTLTVIPFDLNDRSYRHNRGLRHSRTATSNLPKPPQEFLVLPNLARQLILQRAQLLNLVFFFPMSVLNYQRRLPDAVRFYPRSLRLVSPVLQLRFVRHGLEGFVFNLAAQITPLVHEPRAILFELPKRRAALPSFFLGLF